MPTVTVDLVVVVCPACFIAYGIPRRMYDNSLQVKDNGTIYCPSGHTWCYPGKSKEQEIADLKWTVQQRDNRIAEIRAEQAKLEKRMKQGVCPYCRRSFPNVAAHMHTEHGGEKKRRGRPPKYAVALLEGPKRR